MKTYTAQHSGEHQYAATHNGFSYTQNGATVVYTWRQLIGFTHPLVLSSHTPLQIRVKGSRAVTVWLTGEELQSFLADLLIHWKQAEPLYAKKAVFDYSTEERNLWWVWLSVAIVAVGGLGFSLLGDGLQSLHCSRLLKEAGTHVPAKVLKTKKDRRGNINWDVEFTTSSDQTVQGWRVPLVPKGYDLPTENVGVLYAADDTRCWDLTRSAQDPSVNWAQRRFLSTMALGFGSIFSVTSIFMTLISVYKLRRKRPFKEVVAAAGEAAAV